ncbi:MAG: hypothetical protein FWC77_06350 [Defluviitaleaceae bacterium]|nr:hypothetical protein [Defluviitaleaceae bacterium]
MKSLGKSKTTKIIVDILMTVFLALSFVRWDNSNFAFHAIVGTGCALFFTVHVCIHSRWLMAVTKSLLAGTIKKSLKWKYAVNILLLVVWGISIAAGFLAVGYFSFGIGGMAVFSSIHGLTARVGLVLVVIHVFQHVPQIKSYMGIRNKPKTQYGT